MVFAVRLGCRPQVVPALSDMHIAQRAGHFEFGDDLVLDQEAGDLFANDQAVVKDTDSPLLNRTEPALSQLVGKGMSGKPFNEPTSERIGNPESTQNDPSGHRLQQPRIPFIHLHPAHPP
jgi:hypothetical protein